MVYMERETKVVKSGTPGLDELLTIGGFANKSSVLVSGEPGTGKSIVALQYIYNGARLYGEPGIYVTSEQTVEKVKENAKKLGMDLDDLEAKGFIKIMKIPVTHGYELAPDALVKEIKNSNIKRVAVDSITPLEYLSSDVRNFRARILGFIEVLTGMGITLMVTAEKKKTDFDNMEYTPEDFLFDGLVLMGRTRTAISFQRVLSIVKMRGTSHSEDLHPVEISDSGLVVKIIQE